MTAIWHMVLPRQFTCKIENKNNIFQMEVFSMMLLELMDSIGIYMGRH